MTQEEYAALKNGDVVKLHESIIERPDYFNVEGHMDSLLGGKNTATVNGVTFFRSPSFSIGGDNNWGFGWSLAAEDIELVIKKEG